MISLSNKTYWLIGASDGIGYSLAKKMDELGASLVISSRNREGLEQLGNSLKNNARIVTCDVTDLDSVSTAFSSIGNIDGLVYMAGYYATGGKIFIEGQDLLQLNNKELIDSRPTNFTISIALLMLSSVLIPLI